MLSNHRLQILITGTNGFAGRHLVQRLQQAGHQVIAASRSDNGTHNPSLGRVSLSGQSSVQEWSKVLSGCDAVVHCAGKAHVFGGESERPETYHESNVTFTENLAFAAAYAGVKKFIHLSSISVYSDSVFAIMTENTEAKPATEYGRSKLAAEQSLIRILELTDTQYLALRMPLLYGVGAKGNILRLLKLIDRGIPLPLANVNNARTMLSVNNLTSFVEHALVCDTNRSGCFNLADSDSLSTSEIICAIATGLERSRCVFPFPQGVLRNFLRLLNKASVYDKLCDSLLVDSSLIRREFNWRAPGYAWDELKVMASAYRRDEWS